MKERQLFKRMRWLGAFILRYPKQVAIGAAALPVVGLIATQTFFGWPL